MKLFTCLFFSFALLFSFSGSYADWQSETGNNNDSSQNDMGDFDNWDLPPDIHIVSFSNPTIDVQWGMLTKVQANDIGLLDIGSADLRIGFTEKKFDSRHEDILDYSHNFMYLSNSSNSWLTSPNSDDKRVETSAWSFGFGTSGGYGYKLGGDADLSLYHMNGIGWTKTEFKDSTIDRAANDLIRTLGDNFRFGTMFEAGMKLQVFKPIALNVAYERSIVFPRHMFWYWAASEITEGIGQAFLSEFSEAVMDRSPYAGPIVHFVLKNALSYGFYELRKKHMNWPVQTVAPLMYENYKVGLTFAF